MNAFFDRLLFLKAQGAIPGFLPPGVHGGNHIISFLQCMQANQVSAEPTEAMGMLVFLWTSLFPEGLTEPACPLAIAFPDAPMAEETQMVMGPGKPDRHGFAGGQFFLWGGKDLFRFGDQVTIFAVLLPPQQRLFLRQITQTKAEIDEEVLAEVTVRTFAIWTGLLKDRGYE